MKEIDPTFYIKTCFFTTVHSTFEATIS